MGCPVPKWIDRFSSVNGQSILVQDSVLLIEGYVGHSHRKYYLLRRGWLKIVGETQRHRAYLIELLPLPGIQVNV